MSGFFGREIVGKYNVLTRNSITMQKDKAIKPYKNLINVIDQIVISYDKQKIGIEKWIRNNKQGKVT